MSLEKEYSFPARYLIYIIISYALIKSKCFCFLILLLYKKIIEFIFLQSSVDHATIVHLLTEQIGHDNVFRHGHVYLVAAKQEQIFQIVIRKLRR